MYINVSRSQSLINKNRFAKSARSTAKTKPAPRCNHCGGLVRPSGEINSCIMCSRIEDHQCGNCAYIQTA